MLFAIALCFCALLAAFCASVWRQNDGFCRCYVSHRPLRMLPALASSATRFAARTLFVRLFFMLVATALCFCALLAAFCASVCRQNDGFCRCYVTHRPLRVLPAICNAVCGSHFTRTFMFHARCYCFVLLRAADCFLRQRLSSK